MSICLRLGTVGRYCVTKDKIRLSLHFYRRAYFLFSNLMSESVVVIRLSGYPRSIRLALKCEIFVLNSFLEEFLRRSLSASSLMKPFLTPFWQPEKCVFWNVSLGLKCVSIQYRFVCESFTFENVCVKERNPSIWYFSRKLDSLVVLVCLFDELSTPLYRHVGRVSIVGIDRHSTTGAFSTHDPGDIRISILLIRLLHSARVFLKLVNF